jgi:hypothetical protein
MVRVANLRILPTALPIAFFSLPRNIEIKGTNWRRALSFSQLAEHLPDLAAGSLYRLRGARLDC